MVDSRVASILHRETIAALVGARTFERGEACFAAKRVLRVEAGRGELRGTVRPQEAGRADYECRIWMREEGVAYECTCPMGVQLVFCKHTVAIALAHLERERIDVARDLALLREALTTLTHEALVEGLLAIARRDPARADELKRMCPDALARR